MQELPTSCYESAKIVKLMLITKPQPHPCTATPMHSHTQRQGSWSYQPCRNVRSVATRVPLPTSSAEFVGLCFSTHSCPPALAAEPPPTAPLPLLLGPAEAPEERAPACGQRHSSFAFKNAGLSASRGTRSCSARSPGALIKIWQLTDRISTRLVHKVSLLSRISTRFVYNVGVLGRISTGLVHTACVMCMQLLPR